MVRRRILTMVILFMFLLGIGSVSAAWAADLHGHNGQGNGNGGHNSPTGIAGDNSDDENSGHVDCLGDGDSGQGNDDRFCAPPF